MTTFDDAVTLTEFVTARLDEREALARRVDEEVEQHGGVDSGAGVEPGEDGGRWASHLNVPTARVLREVAAIRAIVAEHELVPAHDVWGVEVGGLGCPKCDYEPDLHLGGDMILRSDGCQTLRALASIWSDHPDHQEEWTA